MKNLTKIIVGVLIGLTSIGLMVSCNSPVNPNPGVDPSLTPVAILDFEGISAIPADWVFAAGSGNTATIAAPTLDTTTPLGVTATGGRNYLYAGSGTKTWPDDVDLGNQKLKFVLRTDFATGSSHVTLAFKNLDLSGMNGRTGLEFTMKLYNAGGFTQIGLAPILRYSTALDDNAAVYSAPLNDPIAENFSNSGTVYDWVYFGDDAYLHFKIPFSCFSVPGWGPVGSIPTTIAGALSSGINFNQITFDFRFDVTDASGGAINTNYPGYIDNIGFY